MYNNPYYNPMQTYIPPQRYQPMEQPMQNVSVPNYVPQVQNTNTQSVLLGKLVDSVDVVKSIEYPLDGSISYFPLTDGSAIVTKKLQTDGTSKMIVYKPVDEEKKDTPKYVTSEELKESLKGFDLTERFDLLQEKIDDLKDEFKDFKKNKKKED